MEKVKLTKEQAEEIQKLYTFIHDNDVLNLEFTARELSEIIKFGYEVEKTFEVGDFVDIGLFGVSKIAEVTGVKGNAIAINGSEEYHEFKINRVLTDEEKQEEKQRRWWSEHGRNPWELKENDLIINKNTNITSLVCGRNIPNYWLLKTINDSKLENISDKSIKRNYHLSCFAEDRKDIERT